MEEVLQLRMQDMIYPEDRSDCLILLERMAVGGQDFVVEMRYIRPDGTYLWVNKSVSTVRDPDGQPKYAVAVIRDITQRKQAEEHVEAAMREKEVLLKEIHHRVKNNLQVISSLFHLQSRYAKDRRALELFKESQNRVRSIALIHEQLYRSKELSRIDLTEYIRSLTVNLARTYGVHSDAVRLKINAHNVLLSADTAISCGLIINELVSNSLKYAFPPGKDGEIQIDLRPAQDNQFILTVRDNGVGLPKDLDFRNTESLGLQLVTTLTDQLGGAIELDRGGGTAFSLVFKELKNKEGGQQNGKRADNGC
jgi:two-component sensor histidine kinase